METTYKDHLIKEDFRFSNGKSDWVVYPDNGNEQGYMMHSVTLEEVKAFIDDIIEYQTIN